MLGSGVICMVSNLTSAGHRGHRHWISQPTEESFQLWVRRNGKHLDIQQAATLKRNLFINTVVYLEMCCQEGGGGEIKKIIHLRKIKNKLKTISETRGGGKLASVKQCYHIKRKQYRCAIINCLLVQKYISGHTIQHPVSQIKEGTTLHSRPLKYIF